MKRPFFNRTHLLFSIIFLEGYVVLAVELLSIRMLIPFVGSGTEVVSIIISSILLPLAFGYQWGGNYIARHRNNEIKKGKSRQAISIRRILVKNLFSSLIILGLGLSYLIQEMLFEIMAKIGIGSIVLQAAVFCLLFISYPTFLLAQTVPLVSNYFAKRKLSHMTGWMLCFSTSGSFFGSVFTTIILMMTIGVHNTVILVMCCIGIMVLLLEKRRDHFSHLFTLALLAFIYLLNNSATMRDLKVVSNNAYNMIQIFDKGAEGKVFIVNRSAASSYNPDKGKGYEYIKYIDSRIGEVSSGGDKKILVIGAGGFTVGLDDVANSYTYIDIDPDIKKIAEEYFLPHHLGGNKNFIPMSARAYLKHRGDKYDFIFIDAYTNSVSIPMECTTREFFQAVKEHLNPGGVVAANIVSRPDMSDRFSLRMYNTFASVFPAFSREIIRSPDGWPKAINKNANVIYMYYDLPGAVDGAIYTDDKNTYAIDKPAN